MHLRLVNARSGTCVRRYAQIVQSFRRPDGMPAHKVIAALGELSDQEIHNLRLALDASRKGKAVVLPGKCEEPAWGIRVKANLEYLALAVALEMWEYWRLPELFNRLMPRGGEAVAPGAVVAALALQRCLAPGSKYYAQRWFPKTALPELLDLAPEHFNNTRLHRVLEQLDRVDSALQEELPLRYQQRIGAFSTLFMDVTDTWFEGRGCDLAERDRTKEGFHNRYKVGIVLTCNEHGFPLRWQVVGGKVRDPQCLSDMLDTVKKLPWVGEAPVVCDRAMGNAGAVAKLLDSGLRFLTATRRSEIESYTRDLPHQALADFQPEGTEEASPSDIAEAGRRVETAGLHKVEDLLYVLDLAQQERTLVFEQPPVAPTGADWDPAMLEGAAVTIARARQYRELLLRKEVKNQAALARQEGMTRARISQIMNSLKLDESLQERLLAGEFGYVPERVLRACQRNSNKTAQRRILEEHALTARQASNSTGTPRRSLTGRRRAALRLVVYFNPQMCVEQRLVASRHRQRVTDLVDDLNRRLRDPRSRRDAESVTAEVLGRLSYYSLLGVYSLYIDTVPVPDTGRTCLNVRLDFNEAEWQRRRRYDGFVLLVAHPDLPHSAIDIVRLYREKDRVEKDFQTIKEVVKLRPVYHYTDPKVRAHVTLCMLALLLERTLEYRLKKSTRPMTAPACFEELASCHLNLLATEPTMPPSYTVTEATQEQQAILRCLRLLPLVDDQEMASRIHPRGTP